MDPSWREQVAMAYACRQLLLQQPGVGQVNCGIQGRRVTIEVNGAGPRRVPGQRHLLLQVAEYQEL